MLFDEIDQAVIRYRDHCISESNTGRGYLSDTVRLLRNDGVGIQRETPNPGQVQFPVLIQILRQ